MAFTAMRFATVLRRRSDVPAAKIVQRLNTHGLGGYGRVLACGNSVGDIPPRIYGKNYGFIAGT